ncbi:MAG TPA: DNA methyltransferase, partial [Fimbriiglobus sp.]|nr:DNA methyltransferase [Fimbriiglobus sp.]
MTPHEFAAKWQKTQLTERASYQQHFLDLCDLLGQPHPAQVDPEGKWFTFEKGVTTSEGKQGFADVWLKGKFGWEYKAKHKNLEAAYQQLQRYREALENPPLLIVCDLNTFVIHTNFTSYAKKEYRFTLADLTDPRTLNLLRLAFTDPEQLRPDKRQDQITEEVAGQFSALARGMQARGVEPHRAAHFLMQLVFCMFAEDIQLLERGLFTTTVGNAKKDPARLSAMLADLLTKMASGGYFGPVEVDHFNGGLFETIDVVPLEPAEIELLHQCALRDWGSVEPSIFGTLFERILDPDKRAQLGAHYTSRADIETLLRPVFLDPLRREWEAVRAEADALWAKVEAAKQKAKPRGTFENHVNSFLDRLDHVTVLDPACGSGNFLYVALSMLLDLEKEVRSYLSAKTGQMTAPAFQPTHLMGLEVNAYARELAQVVIWIGYLQWQHENGYPPGARPILPKLETIRRTDAVLDLSDPATPREPQWPDAEFIVGNPPFLGGKMLRSNLGDGYVDAVFKMYGKRLPNFSDLCCYWFEKARMMIESGRTKRAGLLATQGIRGGANRDSLARIKETGDIFFAVSDREWVLDGAAVHISMVGFDDGTQKERTLDGNSVTTINPNLTSTADITSAKRLKDNKLLAFQGPVKVGPFDITDEEASRYLVTPNVNGLPSSDVMTLLVNGADITGRSAQRWIIDFGSRAEANSAQYDQPFEYVVKSVKPLREKNRDKQRKEYWWRLGRSGSDWKQATKDLTRTLFTPRVSKFRLFVWTYGA